MTNLVRKRRVGGHRSESALRRHLKGGKHQRPGFQVHVPDVADLSALETVHENAHRWEHEEVA